MALGSGPVSFQRFVVSGRMPKDVDDAFVAAVKGRTFGYAPPQADSTQVGWLGPRHVLDTEIEAEPVAVGRFAWLGLRVDKLAAPANVVKAYVRLEEEAALQAKGREFLSRGERRLAKEAALARVEKEARSGGFRRMASYGVLLDLEQKTVYLASLSNSVGDKLQKLFSDTFGATLAPLTPESLAGRIAARANQARALESIAPFTLVSPPDGADEEAGTIATDLNFLGKEFLTWLWRQIDADEATLRVQAGDVAAIIDKTLRLKCDFGLTGTTVITADGPAALPEARAALRIGKQPTKAGLIVGGPAGEYRFTLDATRWGVTGLVVPDPEPELDARAKREHRFEALADAAVLLDALFEVFLLRRIGNGWARELAGLTAWASGAREKALRAASA